MSESLRHLRGARIYFDANVFIYHHDEDAKYQACLKALWEMLEDGDLQVVTSEFSLAECLIWPIKSRDRNAQQHFANTLSNGNQLIVVPISREILLEAARLRALHGLEMPDSIHSATAKIARCRWFLTNDAFLASASGAKSILLDTLRRDFEE